jgi:hypothetical protein
MTTQDSFCSHDQAFEGPVYSEGFKGIFRAGGVVSAGFGKDRRYDPLVDFYGNGQQGDQ